VSRPTVFVYAEVSADGKTTHKRGCSSKPMMVYEDDAVRRYRHELRAAAGAIMVGSNTVRLDDPSLTVRHVEGPDPLRVVPASMGMLPLDATILRDGRPTLIAVSEKAPEPNVAALARTGAEVVTLGSDRVDLARLFELLGARGIRSIMVEGGATLLAELFRSRLVDRLIVQHLPVVFGGDDVPAMVGGRAIDAVEEAVKLRLVDAKRVGGHAVIEYEVL
jgi:5-amino-6-(5-phosphoribosylamino)uracil reductase